MPKQKFLVTGALGCIGTWIVANLVREGTPVAILDLDEDGPRFRMLMSPAEIAQVEKIQGDVTDLLALQDALDVTQATHIIHLAGLQVPACKANPPLGSIVNVTGTVNIFEAVRQAGKQVQGLAYASSVAALGPDRIYPVKPVPDDAPLRPDTLYGVYKQANEHTARVYWQDWGVSSVGLRPYIVYGVARDQGLTSDITKAIEAAARSEPFHINFSGEVALQYADDVAKIFIESARAGYQGALVCNVRNDVVSVADFLVTLQSAAPEAAAQITAAQHSPLPFPADLDDTHLRELLGQVPHTPLLQAIQDTLARFQALAA